MNSFDQASRDTVSEKVSVTEVLAKNCGDPGLCLC